MLYQWRCPQPQDVPVKCLNHDPAHTSRTVGSPLQRPTSKSHQDQATYSTATFAISLLQAHVTHWHISIPYTLWNILWHSIHQKNQCFLCSTCIFQKCILHKYRRILGIICNHFVIIWNHFAIVVSFYFNKTASLFVFSKMPFWTIYKKWRVGTGITAQACGISDQNRTKRITVKNCHGTNYI